MQHQTKYDDANEFYQEALDGITEVLGAAAAQSHPLYARAQSDRVRVTRGHRMYWHQGEERFLQRHSAVDSVGTKSPTKSLFRSLSPIVW